MNIKTAVCNFLDYCKYEKNLSSKTLKSYQIDLCQFESFLKENLFSIEISAISKLELRKYIIYISHFKPKSIKRKLASCKALFNFLEFEDEIQINPFRKMKISIKEPSKLPCVLDMQEMIKIFKIVYKSKDEISDITSYRYQEALRDVVIIELLFATGARVSEIANLKEECINVSNGNLTVKGKGNKERIIQICNKETLAILKKYQITYKGKIHQANGFFLVNRFNKKISDQSIRQVVKKIIKKSGITKNITPHSFRHSVATLLLERDVDIKYIQSLLGHSSIMTTQIYTHVNREKQKQILRTKHPRKDFFMFSHLTMDN